MVAPQRQSSEQHASWLQEKLCCQLPLLAVLNKKHKHHIHSLTHLCVCVFHV